MTTHRVCLDRSCFMLGKSVDTALTACLVCSSPLTRHPLAGTPGQDVDLDATVLRCLSTEGAPR